MDYLRNLSKIIFFLVFTTKGVNGRRFKDPHNCELIKPTFRNSATVSPKHYIYSTHRSNGLNIIICLVVIPIKQ